MSSKRGLGSIRKLPSGNYQIRFTDPNGIRRTARRTFKTKALAEIEFSKITNSIDEGTWHEDETPQAGSLDPKTTTLRVLANHWRDQQVSSKGFPLSPNTLQEYQRLIESTLGKFADKPIRAITRQQIETWRAPELKRAPNQTVKAYKHLKTLMTFAHKRNWIATNPCDIERGSAYTPSEPEAPSKSQVQIMLESAEQPFDVVITLAAFGGLRKGEILELRRRDIEVFQEASEKWARVNVTRGVIWVKTTAIVWKPKTEAGIRSVLLPLSVTDVITRHLKSIPIDPDALLFSRKSGTNLHWGEYDLNPKWRKVRAQAGFTGRFHSLRTYAATEFAKLNPTSQELMDRFGHKDIKTAMRYQRSTGRDAELLRRLL
jgi:integrase